MYKTLSLKQSVCYSWENIPKFKDCRKAIFTGAIRTGKTDFGSDGWFRNRLKQVDKTTTKMKGWNKFFVVGVTRDSIFENVIDGFIMFLEKNQYKEVRNFRDVHKTGKKYYLNKTDGALIVRHNGKIAIFKYFGADDKRAFRRIQGRTFRGGFIDEAGLIDIKVLETLEGRCPTWKDSIIVMTTNPEGDENHPFYVHYIKNGWNKNTLVVTFELIDNPIFDEKDVEYYKKVFTKTMFLRKIKGRWVRQEGGCYPKFDKQKHIKPSEEVESNNFMILTIGVDYGATDATCFCLTGITHNLKHIYYIDEYYHKNSEYSQKDINNYIDDFFDFAYNAYKKFNKPIEVFVDSANKSFRMLIERERIKRKAVYIKWYNHGAVDKTKTDIHSSTAIQERIDLENIMLATETVTYSNKCKHLINQTINAVYGKNGERLDDSTTEIDMLDAKEYSTKKYLKRIRESVIFKKGVNKND